MEPVGQPENHTSAEGSPPRSTRGAYTHGTAQRNQLESLPLFCENRSFWVEMVTGDYKLRVTELAVAGSNIENLLLKLLKRFDRQYLGEGLLNTVKIICINTTHSFYKSNFGYGTNLKTVDSGFLSKVIVLVG